MIVCAAIAPHGDPAFAEGSATNEAMRELGRRHREAAPEATVVLTPHNVHVEGSFAVVTAGAVSGRLEELGAEVSRSVDRRLAGDVLVALRAAGLPALGVGYGSNDPELGEMPLDWGALIPLWFLGGEEPVVIVSPARERTPADHVRAGEAIAVASAGRSVAVVASADHGHRHDEDGPFGFHPAAAEYDRRMVDLVRANRLGDVVELARAGRRRIRGQPLAGGDAGGSARHRATTSSCSRTRRRRTSACSVRPSEPQTARTEQHAEVDGGQTGAETAERVGECEGDPAVRDEPVALQRERRERRERAEEADRRRRAQPRLDGERGPRRG